MRKIKIFIFLIISGPALSYGAGTSTGLTLTSPSGARAASLGEAYSAMQNDITALSYNPSSLKSLSSSQASFLYQKGLAEDSYGKLMIGAPLRHGSLGLSVGYYDAGKFDYYNSANGTETSLDAKKDMTVALGYAWGGPVFAMGLSGKYITSELVEQSKATAFAGDFGAQYGFSKNLIFGAAIQNIGTQMKYVHNSESLPRIARAGLMWSLPLSKTHLNFLADAPYYLKESEIHPALGVEGLVGPLALRAGYQFQSELQNLSFGVGFMLGQMSIDYSYGLVQDLSAEQRVSLSMKFGETISKDQLSKNLPASSTQEVENRAEPQIQFSAYQSLGSKVYTVKPGDTLAKIARKNYGDSSAWKKIYVANKHILNNDRELEIGQKVVLP